MSVEELSGAAIGIIGGSGLYEMEGFEERTEHLVQTPFGEPSDKIVVGRLSGRRVCFLPRHGVGHRLLPTEINHRANIWALRFLGVRWLISVTAVGSLREEMAPRDIVIPDQMLDRTGTAGKHTFFGNGIVGHIGFGDPYCMDLRAHLLAAAQSLAPKVHDGGVFVCMNGPAFSTRAEAHFHRLVGGDIIGMTNGPETRLAREAEIAACALALVTDYDCWKEDEEAVDVRAVMSHVQANSAMAKRIIRDVVARIPRLPESHSHRALDTAIMTPQHLWPEQTLQNLAPILGRFDVTR